MWLLSHYTRLVHHHSTQVTDAGSFLDHPVHAENCVCVTLQTRERERGWVGWNVKQGLPRKTTLEMWCASSLVCTWICTHTHFYDIRKYIHSLSHTHSQVHTHTHTHTHTCNKQWFAQLRKWHYLSLTFDLWSIMRVALTNLQSRQDWS